jgi:RecA/RadA recombinase
MMKTRNELKLIKMSDIETEAVRWLWYPYIPFGKLTIVQGDPGEGKTTLVLAVIASLTRGEPLPECENADAPMQVIYQTAEDGLGDTIKPRLEAMGADCSRVYVIDESQKDLTLMDERLEKAVQETGAGLIVLDPLQAYLGSDVDMHRANEIRPIMKRIAGMAEKNGCAVILIGHMNKAQGLKAGYRGLGSIDFRAAARSILLVGRTKDDPSVRIMAQDKNSLAPEGQSIAFELSEENGFRWLGCTNATVDDVLNGKAKCETKTSLMEAELREMLNDGDGLLSDDLVVRAQELGISDRTLKIAKKNLGVVSERRGGRWYSVLPVQEGKGAMS